jgi:hypothetical protein
MKYSETVGRLLGTMGGRVESALERTRLAESLAHIRDGASDLLSHLDEGTTSSAGSDRPSTKAAGAGSGKKGGGARAKAAGEEKRSRIEEKRSRAASAGARSGGVVDAPGKKHRPAPPSERGVKHSDQRIAKLQAASMRGRHVSRG